MGGRPGVEMWAVLEGRRVGRPCVRWPAAWGVGLAPASAAADSELGAAAGAGGEYAGMDSPLDTVVWYEGASETVRGRGKSLVRRHTGQNC